MPNDISTEITNLQNDRTAIRSALAAKGVTATDHNFVDFATDIANIPSGGATEAEEKDINFYDYDGFRVDSWTLAELANKTELPSNPDRTSEGLTADGWNWTLADLKTQNTPMDVGQSYHPTDNKLHIFVDIASPSTLSCTVALAIIGTADIDWGDGSALGSITGVNDTTAVAATHTYASVGQYEIVVGVDEVLRYAVMGSSSGGTWLFCKDTSASEADNANHHFAIKKIYLPSNYVLSNYAFRFAMGLTKIAYPAKGVAFSAFHQCYALPYITLPSGVPSLAYSAFGNCQSLRRISIPKSLTSLNDQIFVNCTILEKVFIPEGVTSIGGFFVYGTMLMTSITIPSTVTTIAANAFSTASAKKPMLEFHFKPSAPPTVANANAFSNIATDCIIYVPYSADHSVLQSYKTAANYPDPSVYTYEEY